LLKERTEVAIERAMHNARVIMPKALALHIAPRVRCELDGPGLRVSVLDESGNPRIREDGKAVSLPELLREIQINDEDLSLAFDDPVASNVAIAARNGKVH
jgi:hypothetical protein